MLSSVLKLSTERSTDWHSTDALRISMNNVKNSLNILPPPPPFSEYIIAKPDFNGNENDKPYMILRV